LVEFYLDVQISQIQLNNFRNFTNSKFAFGSELNLIYGDNGVGKTSILEAITMVGRSDSIRGADLNQIVNIASISGNGNNLLNKSSYELRDRIADLDKGRLSIHSLFSNNNYIDSTAFSFDYFANKKQNFINQELLSAKKFSDFKRYLPNIIFLTPQLEQLFILGKGERRLYLDKIVSDIDIKHSQRLNNYQKLTKERISILQKSNNSANQKKWLDIIENQIVELGVIIASSRVEAVDFFNKAIDGFISNFPKPKLLIIGDIEQDILNQKNSVIIEANYKEKLENNRQIDTLNFKTNFGIHRSDFMAILREKNIEATKCSTGEQKAMMISITLARAKISSLYKNNPTILIFDEIVSHLDEKRKIDLFYEICDSKLQSFFSATSMNMIPNQFTGSQIKFLELKK